MLEELRGNGLLLVDILLLVQVVESEVEAAVTGVAFKQVVKHGSLIRLHFPSQFDWLSPSKMGLTCRLLSLRARVRRRRRGAGL